MVSDVVQAVASFGESVKQKLVSPVAVGQPEDQLRAPFEALVKHLAIAARIGTVVAVGEAAQSDLKTRPDYAVTVQNVLVGHVELKAPGKGADPRKFTDKHDVEQWKKLRLLPNLLYTDGNAFSLWRNGELSGEILTLDGDIRSSGNQLRPPVGFAGLFEDFFRWQPITPRSAKELAHTSARLCRLLRDEVVGQLARGLPALTHLASEWRALLFPDASDERFADGYAQAVTFGLLMARVKGISLAHGLQSAALELSQQSSLIGSALRLLVESPENRKALQTSLETLTRVLDAVEWAQVSKSKADAWLYFYEDFLDVYDKKLRKMTGSYYTEPEVVSGMVALVDQVLRDRFPSFAAAGLSSPKVRIADPATGTGTFPLGVLRSIAVTAQMDGGQGTVPGAVNDALRRLVALEMQLGPYAVAQLRLLAEVIALTQQPPATEPLMYVTDTLGDPNNDPQRFSTMVEPIGRQRKQANQIMRDQSITVVIGNPPYKNAAKGRGGWIENYDGVTKKLAPFRDWLPPSDWQVGAHAKHLRNLYIYFWRWATWKVFDHGDGKTPGPHDGIVCFITVTGFLNGPGFQRMRSYLRQTCNDIWVIDCSPEGHQPDVSTRFFGGVQQPICIVLASRSGKQGSAPAVVRFRALPKGKRTVKFDSLNAIRLDDGGWTDCPAEPRAPFLPASTGAWSTFPALEDFFLYNGSGVMPGRTWIIAPDAETLERRWSALTLSPAEQKQDLFQPHTRGGKLGDKHADKVVRTPLAGFAQRLDPVSIETGSCEQPLHYGFRTLDRQFILPDSRLINQPNPELWASRSNAQIYLTAPSDRIPTMGPALSFSGLVPDLHHYNGRGGRAFPLWAGPAATESNLKPSLLAFLTQHYGVLVTAPGLMAYLAAIAAHPAYTARFQEDLSTPGLRIPITGDAALFQGAVELGSRILWLYTFGERMADPAQGRPHGPPRLPDSRRPTIPQTGTIPATEDGMPDNLGYDPNLQRLFVGDGGGFIDNVTPAMRAYQVSGKNVLTQWFSYRKRYRERPVIGDRRPPSALEQIRPVHWLPEYTAELLNVLNILGLLIDLEPQQADLLSRICNAQLIGEDALNAAGALYKHPLVKKRKRSDRDNGTLFPATE